MSDFDSDHDLTAREFEPHFGLCAESSEPGACFGFCVSLSLCPQPTRILSLPLSKINEKNIKKKLKNKLQIAPSTFLLIEGFPYHEGFVISFFSSRVHKPLSSLSPGPSPRARLHSHPHGLPPECPLLIVGCNISQLSSAPFSRLSPSPAFASPDPSRRSSKREAHPFSQLHTPLKTGVWLT